MQNTTNLGLKKYELTDQWHVTDQNENLDKIDACINDVSKVIAAGGTGTAITLSLPSVTAYEQRKKYSFIAPANNGGNATTIKINDLAAKPLYKPATTTAPTLIAGKVYEVWDGGTAFFFKAAAEGDAQAADVLAGKTFSNDNDAGIVGTLALTGTAAASEVVAGKTFYNTDAKTKQTGTGANAKRCKSGSGTFVNGLLTVTGLGFTPSLIVVLVTSGTYKYRLLYHAASNFSATLYFNGVGWAYKSVNMLGLFGDTSGNSNGYGTVSPISNSDQDWSINSDGFISCKFNSVPNGSAQWWAYE